jgi:hypothetical protein
MVWKYHVQPCTGIFYFIFKSKVVKTTEQAILQDFGLIIYEFFPPAFLHAVTRDWMAPGIDRGDVSTDLYVHSF